MTESKPTETPLGRVHVGDKLHVRRAGYLFAGRVWNRGDVFEVDSDMIALSLDRLGNSSLDRVGDEGSALGLGDWPRDEPILLPGTPEFYERRETLRRQAWTEPDPERRAARLREVAEQFGPPPTTSTTLNSAKNPSERLALEQAQRLAQSNLRQRSDYRPEERP